MADDAGPAMTDEVLGPESPGWVRALDVVRVESMKWGRRIVDYYDRDGTHLAHVDEWCEEMEYVGASDHIRFRCSLFKGHSGPHGAEKGSPNW